MLWIASIQLNAQDPLAGKKFIQGFIDLNNNTVSNKLIPPANIGGATENRFIQNMFILNSTAQIGKIDNNLKIKSVGFVFNTVFRNQSNSNEFELKIGPSIGRGKFVKLYEKVYYVPITNFSALGIYGTSKDGVANLRSRTAGAGINLSITLLRLGYLLQEKILLLAGIGDIGAFAKYSNTSSEAITNTDSFSKSATTNFNVGFRGNIIGSTSFGVTYLFN